MADVRGGPEPQPVTSTVGNARDNRRMLAKLALFAVMMFGFGWAMVPLYNAICEATGLRILTKRDQGADLVARNTQVDKSRTVTIEFDSNIHGPWEFRARTRSIQVHPGELATVEYELRNLSDRRMSGQAIPSFAPSQAARHFRKVQCFCFEQQTLDGRAVRDFPVVFVVDPALPENVDRITLSYTYFDVGVQGTPAPAGGKLGNAGAGAGAAGAMGAAGAGAGGAGAVSRAGSADRLGG